MVYADALMDQILTTDEIPLHLHTTKRGRVILHHGRVCYRSKDSRVHAYLWPDEAVKPVVKKNGMRSFVMMLALLILSIR